MKGDESSFNILLVIIIIVLIFLILWYFLDQIQKTGEGVTEEKDFRWYCVFWSQTGYRGTTVEIGAEVVDMAPICEKALGVSGMPSEPDDPYWERCRDACRLRETDGG